LAQTLFSRPPSDYQLNWEAGIPPVRKVKADLVGMGRTRDVRLPRLHLAQDHCRELHKYSERMCRWPPSTDIQSGTGTLNSTTLRAHPAAGGSLEDVTVLAVPPTHSDLDEAFVDTWADTILNTQTLERLAARWLGECQIWQSSG